MDGLTFDVNGLAPYSISIVGPSFLSMVTYQLVGATRNVIAQLKHPAVFLDSYASYLEYGGKKFELQGKDKPVGALGRFELGIEALDLWFEARWSMMSTEISSELDDANPELVAIAVLTQFMLIINWNRH